MPLPELIAEEPLEEPDAAAVVAAGVVVVPAAGVAVPAAEALDEEELLEPMLEELEVSPLTWKAAHGTRTVPPVADELVVELPFEAFELLAVAVGVVPAIGVAVPVVVLEELLDELLLEPVPPVAFTTTKAMRGPFMLEAVPVDEEPLEAEPLEAAVVAAGVVVVPAAGVAVLVVVLEELELDELDELEAAGWRSTTTPITEPTCVPLCDCTFIFINCESST
jgi:hypothetical protein